MYLSQGLNSHPLVHLDTIKMKDVITCIIKNKTIEKTHTKSTNPGC